LAGFLLTKTKKPESFSFEIRVVLGAFLENLLFQGHPANTGFLGYKYQVQSVKNKLELNAFSVW
jgi:hypothetical protein